MHHIFHCRQWGGLALAALLIQAVGCGGPAAPPRKYADVAGTVTYDGKPLTMGTVMFQPPSGAIVTGKIQSNGTYSLKGVIGANTVTIVSTDSEPAQAAAPTEKKPLVMPKSHIPEIYGTPASALSFEVKAGKNTANFDLK